jgi:DNA helicase-2/ATP-dependent DNA helicase PcrA
MKKLTLSYAIKRFLHGQSIYAYPSRFIDEIPQHYKNSIKQKFGLSENDYKSNNSKNQNIFPESDSQLSVGANVKHAKFGYGTVLNFEGKGDSTRVQIKFKKAGTKWLISSYANLEFV